MQTTASAENVSDITSRLETLGYHTHLSHGEERTIIGILGNGSPLDSRQLGRMIGVQRVVEVSKPYKLASRDFYAENTTISLGDVVIGGNQCLYMAGCSMVESRSQILEIAQAVKESGGDVLRAGVYKGRTSPYSFQGLGMTGLEYLAEAGKAVGLPIITEVTDPSLIYEMMQFTDMFEIGERNMQNYRLLNAVGSAQHPVLLNRRAGTSVEHLLMSYQCDSCNQRDITSAYLSRC